MLVERRWASQLALSDALHRCVENPFISGDYDTWFSPCRNRQAGSDWTNVSAAILLVLGTTLAGTILRGLLIGWKNEKSATAADVEVI